MCVCVCGGGGWGGEGEGWDGWGGVGVGVFACKLSRELEASSLIELGKHHMRSALSH